MNFAHTHHRQTYDLLGEMLAELFEGIVEEEGHFYVRYGSTVIELAVEPHGEEDTSVVIMAYCVQDAELDDDLALGLLELNHSLAFGAFSVVGNDIFFSHNLYGRSLDRGNLLNAVTAVADISDDYDDRIVAKFGGQRALDRIRGTGGRRRRSQQAAARSETPPS
ncbi:MAG: YbjN domain-containing protein [Acidobacteriota bacterium]